MVSNNHRIDLYVNNELIELESQDSLNLRINNQLFIPTRTVNKQAEYSYEFEIPATENNNRILGYANNLSKLNKFNRYPCQVYADGHIIFNGSILVQEYDGESKMYSCNLVNYKLDSLEDIFGDAVMSDAQWMVDYEGAPTINSVNPDLSKKYYFPLICYGAYQKNYITKDEVAADYTSKFLLDKYNRWWNESFYPSLNVLETIRKAYEWKGYNVDGNAFYDPYLSNIYASCNLAQEQAPIYNLGNPKFGELHLRATWRNDINMSTQGDGGIFESGNGGLTQDLSFPYFRVIATDGYGGSSDQDYYNFSTIEFWNMLDTVNNPQGVTVNVLNDTYMYDPNEMCIVIPSDGFYEINMSTNLVLLNAGQTFSATQWTIDDKMLDHPIEEKEVTITKNLNDCTPIEIQLIKNYDENIELIKGKKNITYYTGDPSQPTYQKITSNNVWDEGTTMPNRTTWNTDFPHQELFGSKPPTKTDSITNKKYQQLTTSDKGDYWDEKRNRRVAGAATTNTYGFMHKDNSIMPYDQAVSEAFICGFSSFGDGTVSVMKDGKSWTPLCSINNEVFANVDGLDVVKRNENGSTVTEDTTYCKNEYQGGAYSISTTNSTLNGSLKCCVYLHKNDILELVAIQRDFDAQKYACSAQVFLDIRAISKDHKALLKSELSDFGYGYESQFPSQLNLFNFTNNETRIADWINNIKTAFNLDITQSGKNITIDTNKNLRKNITYAVDIDDRFNSNMAKSEIISYPREMSVKYKIDTEEWGFEKTVPQEHINDEGDEWKKWGDSGFTVIQLANDPYETSTQNITTNFSYTYYDNFTWREVLSDGTETTNEVQIRIPVIEKAEYMADGYGYEEAMKHDGYSFTQRFWYRNPMSLQYVWFSSHMKEKVFLTYPSNTFNNFNLSYKDNETSILTEYFNAEPLLSSNYVYVDVYLTGKEYEEIKNGALVHFDKDLYYVSEIQGFDASGVNPTTLKLIKKV